MFLYGLSHNRQQNQSPGDVILQMKRVNLIGVVKLAVWVALLLG